MNKNQSWDELFRSICDVVEPALNSKNYHNMAKNVGKVASAAAGMGTEAVRRATQSVQAKAVSVQNLYGKTGGKVIGGILKSFFGSCGTFFFGLAMLGFVITGELLSLLSASVTCAAMLAGSAWMLVSGVGTMKTVKRFRTYKKLLDQKTQCALDRLARAVGKDVPFVRRDVQRMIGSGYFLEGHLDHEQKHLIISDDTYRRFEQARLQMEAQQKQRAAEAANAPDPRIREVLDKGSAFIAQIRKCNDDIPGQAVSEKIDRIELLVRRIFDRARSNPEIIPDLKKMMDYYLPMTVKLLTAYADMDAQPIQGENILNSKREIEATLDTLDQAFQKFLDELYQETAMDISSDISVLNAMLAREGLTEDDLTKMRKEQNLL